MQGQDWHIPPKENAGKIDKNLPGGMKFRLLHSADADDLPDNGN
jgi:hypothetical protein